MGAQASGPFKRAAGLVGGLTLVSRVLGFLRDVFTAYFLGAGYFSDAFFVAFRIPNLFRRLFGEGALTVAFVPIFTRLLMQEGKEVARHFMRSAFSLLFLVLVLLVVVGELFAYEIAWLFAGGFDDKKLELTTSLLRVVFPYILLISLVALSMGILNSLKHFAMPAFSPSLLNVAMIGSLLLSPFVDLSAVYCLAIGVLVGGVLQLLVQLAPLAKRGFLLMFSFQRPTKEVMELAKLMFPAVFGAAAYQLNLLINTQLASRLPEGSVSYLYYADRLVEFPMGVVAVAIGTAILPFLSQQAASGDMQQLKQTFRDGIKSLYLLIFPAIVGLVLLRQPIIELFFQRQAFTESDARATAFALFFSAFGLLGAGGLKILLPVFYSMKDMWTPFWASLLAVVINLCLALFFMGPLLHGGLALAVALSAFCNAMMLLVILRRRIGRLGLSTVFPAMLKMAVAALIMALPLFLLQRLLGWDQGITGSRLLAAVYLFATIGGSALIYFFACRLFKLEEASQVFAVLRRKLAP